MGKKKSNNQGENKQNDQNNKDEGKKDGGGSMTFVLKTDMQHCEGCATKIKKCIRAFKGVESFKSDEKDRNKLSVTGKVDPVKLREKLEQKTKKKVELVSPPLPKKDKENDKDNGGGGGEKKPSKKPDDKNSKEPPLTTAVLKMDTHCEGCIQKIQKLISKTKGFHEMSVDPVKDLVTVKGAMDMKAMAETLKERMKRKVEIVPAKKDGGGGDGKKEKGGGDNKEKGGGGGEGGKAAAVDGGGGNKADQNRLEFVPPGHPFPFPFPPVASDHSVHFPVHAPQMFSDENPNACSVM